jgi:hypothetical protein
LLRTASCRLMLLLRIRLVLRAPRWQTCRLTLPAKKRSRKGRLSSCVELLAARIYSTLAFHNRGDRPAARDFEALCLSCVAGCSINFSCVECYGVEWWIFCGDSPATRNLRASRAGCPGLQRIALHSCEQVFSDTMMHDKTPHDIRVGEIIGGQF